MPRMRTEIEHRRVAGDTTNMCKRRRPPGRESWSWTIITSCEGASASCSASSRDSRSGLRSTTRSRLWRSLAGALRPGHRRYLAGRGGRHRTDRQAQVRTPRPDHSDPVDARRGPVRTPCRRRGASGFVAKQRAGEMLLPAIARRPQGRVLLQPSLTKRGRQSGLRECTQGRGNLPARGLDAAVATDIGLICTQKWTDHYASLTASQTRLHR